MQALATTRGIDINLPCAGFGNESALHFACSKHVADGRQVGFQSAEMAEVLLLTGGCRFLRDEGGNTPLDLAEGHTGLLKVFASGVDYWQRRRHGGHSWAMREAVTTLLLVRQRLDAYSQVAALSAAPHLPHVPEEIWLVACGFLRSADFTPLVFNTSEPI